MDIPDRPDPQIRKRKRRRAGAIDFGTILLQRRTGRSLHRQVAEAIREAILDGRLPPGTLLPSTRLLAEDLGISRTTTSSVFEQLAAEGLIEPAVGSGTRVTRSIPVEFINLANGAPRGPTSIGNGPRPFAASANRFSDFIDSRSDSMPRPFTPGVPAIDQFPIAAWTAMTAKSWRKATVADLCSPNASGANELCSALANHAGASRGANCDPSSILIVTGAQQALGLAVQVLTDPGDICWMEEPGYLGARYAFTMAGVRLVGAPVDEAGLNVELAIATLPPPRVIYVTPSHQYPLGGTLPLERRIALLRYADRVGAWVIEDDYDSEYSYASAPVPCLQGLDPAGRVLYVGSLNKTLFPGLRLGFMIAPQDLMPALRAVRTHADGHPPAINQSVLAEFIATGSFVSHIRKMRSVYTRRRDAVVEALERRLPWLQLGVHDRGLHFVGYLRGEVDDRVVSARARDNGIVVPPLSRFYLERPERRGLVFGFACVTPGEVDAAAARLQAALEEFVPA